jgi:hypothetical protein
MGTVTLDLVDAAPYFANLQQSKFREAALRGLLSAAERTQQEIVLRIIPSKSPSPVDRAASGYLGGWRSYAVSDGAVVENLETHAAFIEYGVKNVRIGGQMIRALAAWAVRKGVASQADALQAAWGIAKRMQARGGIFNSGQGFGILKEATEQHVPRFLREEVARELGRL